jgi:hypothetical protein
VELIVSTNDMKVMAEYWLNKVHLATPVKVTEFEAKNSDYDKSFTITYESSAEAPNVP